MPLIRPSLVKRKPLKSVSAIDDFKSIEFGLGILPIIKPIVSQLYIIELELPPEINKLITTVYNTFIDPPLY